MGNTIWRPVVGYEGLYEVSDYGSVRSFRRFGAAGGYIKPHKTLGYNIYKLFKNNKRRNILAHRIVAMAFIPNPNCYPQVNHMDGNKQNNRVSNLEWCDSAHNMRHAREILGRTQRGENNSNAKFSEREVKFIRWIHLRCPDVKVQRIAEFYGVGNACIYKIWDFKTWKTI